MIDTRELRIGNLVKDAKGFAIVVESITKTGINFKSSLLSEGSEISAADIFPIELTEPILVKFGLVEHKSPPSENHKSYTSSLYGAPSIHFITDGNGRLIYTQEAGTMSLHYIGSNLNYVHEFQNLMFLGTDGRDLSIDWIA